MMAVYQGTRTGVVKVVLALNQASTVEAHQINSRQVVDVLTFGNLGLFALLFFRVLQLLHETTVLARGLLHQDLLSLRRREVLHEVLFEVIDINFLLFAQFAYAVIVRVVGSQVDLAKNL